MDIDASLLKQTPSHQIHAFYMDIPWRDYTYKIPHYDYQIVNPYLVLLKSYFNHFVIGFEEARNDNKTPHVHVFALGPIAKYQAFRNKAVKKYKLIGRSTAGVRRQYGKIKGVLRSPQNMISYTIKHGMYGSHGFNINFLKRMREIAYIKQPTDLDKYNQLIKTIKLKINEHSLSDLAICIFISKEYFNVFNKPITPRQADKLMYQAGLLTDKMLAHLNFKTYLNSRCHDYPDQDFPSESIIGEI